MYTHIDKINNIIIIIGSNVNNNIYANININNNNRKFFDLQVANCLSTLRFEANLCKEDSESTKHSKSQR